MKADRGKVKEESFKEKVRFKKKRCSKSLEMHRNNTDTLLNGVPMNWLTLWPDGLNVYAEMAKGCTITDIDGNEYSDFCLGDTGAMTGHSPDESIDVIYKRFKHSDTATMLPNEDHIWVCQEMKRRFGLDKWQFAISASDANRFAIQWARFATGRKKKKISS